jgi:hypothetical protein
MVGIDHLETPVSFTLLPPTLAVKSWAEYVNVKLTHSFFTSV